MSKNYYANQYQASYNPTSLCNWEVPKLFNGHVVNKLGRNRLGSTKIISNDRGHLIPGVPRQKNPPWVNFPTTWHLPKKISKKQAYEINGLNKFSRFVCPSKKEKEPEKVVKDLDEYVAPPINEEKNDAVDVEDEEKEDKETWCPYHDA